MIKNNQLVMNKIWINTYSQVKDQIRKLIGRKTRNKMFLVSNPVWYKTKYSIYEGTVNIIINAYQIKEQIKNTL